MPGFIKVHAPIQESGALRIQEVAIRPDLISMIRPTADKIEDCKVNSIIVFLTGGFMYVTEKTDDIIDIIEVKEKYGDI